MASSGEMVVVAASWFEGKALEDGEVGKRCFSKSFRIILWWFLACFGWVRFFKGVLNCLKFENCIKFNEFDLLMAL